MLAGEFVGVGNTVNLMVLSFCLASVCWMPVFLVDFLFLSPKFVLVLGAWST